MAAPFTAGVAATPAVLHDTSDWNQRAIWWNREWRYRIPVTVTAPSNTALYDKRTTVSISWDQIFTELGIVDQALDPGSLRLVEYTPGGHIQYRQTDNLNRLETLPLLHHRQ